MINGAHAILYSDDADATRAALAKVLGTRSVDAGGGWRIFALPPAELAIHPADEAAGPSSTCSATTSPPPWPPSRPPGSSWPGRSATRARACSRPSPSLAGSSSASMSRATRLRSSPAELHRALEPQGVREPGLEIQNADPVGANGDAGHWLSTQLRYPGLSLLIAK
jgi:hypothetical protein